MATRNLFLICGPSGVGKTTVVNTLLQKGFTRVISSTTRSPRSGEGPADYNFMAEDEFLNSDELLAVSYYNDYYYGVHLNELLTKDLFIVEPKGVQGLKSNLYQRPVKVIGLIAHSDTLRTRLLPRGVAGFNRWVEDKAVFSEFRNLCDVVISNEELDITVAEILAYITSAETFSLLN